MNANNFYGLEKNNYFIHNITRKFIINSVLSMVFLYAAQMIDTVLVGKFIGENGLSAMSIVSPIFFIFYTIGATIGIGASIVGSRSIGSGDFDNYRRAYTCASIILFSLAAIILIFGYAFLNKITLLFSGNASHEVVELSKEYLAYYLPGGAFMILAYIPFYFLRTEGKPNMASVCFFLSAILNVIFTWLFLSPIFDMGIKGASLATSISYGVSATVGYIALLHGNSELRFVSKSMNLQVLKETAWSGVPIGISNFLESMQVLIVNMLIINIGAARLLPCYTIVRNIIGLNLAVILGLSSALVPLVGVFFGEHDHDNIRTVMHLSKRIGIIVMAILTLIICLIPEFLCKLFGVKDPAVISECQWAIPFACLGLVAAYINSLYSSYFSAIKKEWIGTVITLLSKFVLIVLFAVSLSSMLGIRGIWLSYSFNELATLLSLIIMKHIVQNRNTDMDKLLLDTSVEQDGDISFSIENNTNAIVMASKSCSDYFELHNLDNRRCTQISLAIEELLTFLINNSVGTESKKYIDVRALKVNDGVTLRFRYVGKPIDPIVFYTENSANPMLSEELLGLKLIFKSSKNFEYRQNIGANYLMLEY